MKNVLWGVALVLLVTGGYMLLNYGELALGLGKRMSYTFLITLVAVLILDRFTHSKDGFIVFALKFLASFVVVSALVVSHRLIFEPVYLPSSPAIIQHMSDKELQQLSNQILIKNWQSLSKKDKIDLLQQVVNHEAAELKLKNGIPVQAAELYSKYEDGITLASYVRWFKKIIINSSMLDESGEVVLKSTLHEIRHAQQDYLAKSYENGDIAWMSEETLKLAKQFSKDFEYKKNAILDYNGYYEQFIERDARDYSIQRCKYYVELAFYLEELPDLQEN